MAKRSFLITVAAALAALTSPAEAMMKDQPTASPNLSNNIAETLPPIIADAQTHFYQKGTELFGFILGKGAKGEIIAAHASHESHASHASHRSHYSSR